MEFPNDGDELALDQALVDYLANCDLGATLDRASFLEQYPEPLRAKLAELLDTADWIEQLSGRKLVQLSQTIPIASAAQMATVGFASQSIGLTQPSEQHKPIIHSAIRLPSVFGEYLLERIIGRGGMGVVYYARQVQLDRPVAIKMIRAGALASPEEVQRFYSEARSAAQLAHPNIVNVYQCGEIDGHHYFSMDYIEGTDLDRMSRSAPLACKTAAKYVRDVARAIDFAHQRGIVHRDLKPANVLVDQSDTVRITDFGLAKNIRLDSSLTASGVALGTPSFMSPEQAAGKIHEQGVSTDVYSLGAILFSVLAGQPPFRAATAYQTIMHVIHRPAPSVRSLRGEVDLELDTIVEKCLQKSAEDRYASADDLAADLDRYLQGLPITARPLSGWSRAWHWLLGVPIIGAAFDSRVVEPTQAHRWVQRGIIIAAILMLFAWLIMLMPDNLAVSQRIPSSVKIAGGSQGGPYSLIAGALAEAMENSLNYQTDLLHTQGSAENVQQLLDRSAHLAIIQSDMIEHQEVAVVAPLYYEAVHLLASSDSSITDLGDLKHRRVYIGKSQAGSRTTAQRLLSFRGLKLEDLQIVEDLTSQPPFEAAILVTRVGAREIFDLLSDNAYRLLDFQQAWEFALEEPAFHPMRITTDSYPPNSIQGDGINTVAATAFLVCRQDSPDRLVRNVLETLYDPKLRELTGVLTAEQAAHWQGIAWHSAAQLFFQAYRGIRPPP